MPRRAKAADPRQERLHDSEGEEGSRSRSERDRDAILHSSCFRRLGGVTQVVDPGEGHVFHNRLTHSLEVAQIGLRLAQKLERELRALRRQGQDVAHLGTIDPNVVEAAALAHDLGHPPFGHIAEKVLNALVQKAGLQDGYEGNAQSFRILTKLTVRRAYKVSPGLNLTRATLDATLKYPWLQRLRNRKQVERKWGVYRSEIEDFRFARRLHEKGDRSQSLEAQIMDWSDDIAYSVSDTEDFYRAGLIPLGQLASSMRIATATRTKEKALEEFMDDAFQRREEMGITNEWPEEDMRQAFRDLFNSIPFGGSYEPTIRRREEIRNFTSLNIGRFVNAVSLRRTRGPGGELLKVRPVVKMQVEMLKELTWRYVIRGPALAALQQGQKRIIESLFRVFCDAAFENRADKWDVLPVGSRDYMRFLREEHGSIRRDQRVRIAADAVASMTDRQAVEMCKRLTGVAPGSAFNQILG